MNNSDAWSFLSMRTTGNSEQRRDRVGNGVRVGYGYGVMTVEDGLRVGYGYGVSLRNRRSPVRSPGEQRPNPYDKRVVIRVRVPRPGGAAPEPL